MPKPILIVKNSSTEGAGMFAEILKERGLPYNIINLNNGDSWPDVQNYGAVIVLGGPNSANDQTPKIQTELTQIQKILQQKIPYLGICLGLQTLIKAAGGQVIKNSIREIGLRDPDNNFFTINLTDKGKEDSLFSGLKDSLITFQAHGETVQPTADMRLLATGKFCHNQAVLVGQNAYGLQCHFEVTDVMLAEWLARDADLQKVDKNKLEADFASIKDEYATVGRQLFANFLRIAGY